MYFKLAQTKALFPLSYLQDNSNLQFQVLYWNIFILLDQLKLKINTETPRTLQNIDIERFKREPLILALN